MTSNTERYSIPNMDTSCFACGSENPHGLHMSFFTDGERLYSTLTPPSHVSGWDTLMHGGIISTILDEIMAWTAIHMLQRVILTKSIQVDFLRPIHVNRQLEVQGWVQEQESERKAWIQGAIFDAKGQEMARSRGEMVLFDPDSKAFEHLLPEMSLDTVRRRLGKEDTGK